MKKTSLATQYVIYFGLILLFANIVLGVVLMIQSTNSLQSVIRKNMLDISNSAANLVDGDLFDTINEDTLEGEAFKEVYAQLSVFQHNVDIKYIYSARKIDEDTFIFVVDADPDEPAAYGELLVVSQALKTAATGTPDIDNATVSDRWGTFYTAYSPIRNSAGNIVGVVGVDIDAAWYDAQTQSHAITILIISALFTAAGIAIVFLINARVKKRFSVLEGEISNLSKDVDALTGELQSNADYQKIRAHMLEEANSAASESEGDEISALSSKVRSLHVEMNRYLEYAGEAINTDALTGVGSMAAYLERCSELDGEICTGNASYATILFDINRLKQINDTKGHNTGDTYICAAAQAIAKTFGIANTYRIGGDEFIVISKDTDKLEGKVESVNKEISSFNIIHKTTDIPLSVSGGVAVFDPDTDRNFRTTFNRADANMYQRKKETRI